MIDSIGLEGNHIICMKGIFIKGSLFCKAFVSKLRRRVSAIEDSSRPVVTKDTMDVTSISSSRRNLAVFPSTNSALPKTVVPSWVSIKYVLESKEGKIG